MSFSKLIFKSVDFLLLVRGPSTNLYGNTTQPFPRLPGRHPRHRRGPGHPGEWEYGSGRGRADAQPARGAELWHPEWHGVHVSSHQDWQGELPDMVIKAPASSSSPSVPSELLPALACEGFMDAFKDAAASISGLLPLLQRGGSSSSDACCALLFFYFVCVFKAGPWTDNYTRVPRFILRFCRWMAAILMYSWWGVALFPAWVHVHPCNSCHYQLSPGVSFFFLQRDLSVFENERVF